MGILETFLGDLQQMVMQQQLLRWGLALAASLWVWLIGDEYARGRRFYLLAPFAVAGLIEVWNLLEAGPMAGGKISQLLVVQEAARKIASPIGLGAVLLAAILGYMRGIGFAIGVAVLLAAYFVDGIVAKEGQRVLSFGGLSQMLLLLPTILLVMLTSYGIGASFRRFRENHRVPE